MIRELNLDGLIEFGLQFSTIYFTHGVTFLVGVIDVRYQSSHGNHAWVLSSEKLPVNNSGSVSSELAHSKLNYTLRWLRFPPNELFYRLETLTKWCFRRKNY